MNIIDIYYWESQDFNQERRNELFVFYRKKKIFVSIFSRLGYFIIQPQVEYSRVLKGQKLPNNILLTFAVDS